MKKILTAVLLLTVLAAALCACNAKAWEYDGSTRTLYVNSDSVMIPYKPDNPDNPENATITNAPWAKYLPEIENIVVGDSVTKISEYALAYGSSVKTVRVGKNVTSLGWRCFYRCGDWRNQSDITMEFHSPSRSTFGEDVFGYTWDNPNVVVCVPADLLADWRTANGNHGMRLAILIK